jgi:uncharacterized protein YneF (UPF0154 family)
MKKVLIIVGIIVVVITVIYFVTKKSTKTLAANSGQIDESSIKPMPRGGNV